MSDAAPQGNPSTLLNQARQQSGSSLVSLVRADQRKCWQRGARVRTEVYLQAYPALQNDTDAVLELIYNEVFLREDRGEAPRLEEYLRRFPHYTAALHRMFEVHRALEAASILDPEVQQTTNDGSAAPALALENGAPATPPSDQGEPPGSARTDTGNAVQGLGKPQRPHALLADSVEDTEPDHGARRSPDPSRTRSARVWFGPSLGTVVVGLVGGGLAAVALILGMVPALLGGRLHEITAFPGQALPWYVREWPARDWIALLCALPVVSMGLITALLVRPKDFRGDLFAGLATGTVAALTAYLIGFGWIAVLGTTLVLAHEDFELLRRFGQGREAPGRGADLVKKNPQLRSMDELERSTLLAHKLQDDLVRGMPLGIWLGLLAALLVCEPLAVSGTVVAGYLVRRRDRPAAVVGQYLEAALAGAAVLGIPFLLQQFAERDGWGKGVLAVALLGQLALLGWTAVRQRWDWRRRAALYAVWVPYLLFLWTPALPWPFLAAATVGAGGLLYLHGPWSRQFARKTRA
jgi:hypothetical protein